MMHQIELYNESIKEGEIDKSQYGFQLDISGKQGTRKALRDKRNKEIRTAINQFLMAMKNSNSVKVIPMGRMDFSGLKQGDDFEYDTQTLVGFPYRVGVIQYQYGTTLFIKLGILLVKGC